MEIESFQNFNGSQDLFFEFYISQFDMNTCNDSNKVDEKTLYDKKDISY